MKFGMMSIDVMIFFVYEKLYGQPQTKALSSFILRHEPCIVMLFCVENKFVGRFSIYFHV